MESDNQNPQVGNMAKRSKTREKYFLEKYFGTKNKKDIPTHINQFGCRDCDITDEEFCFITQHVTSIDRLILGGTLVTESGLEYLKKIKTVEHLDLRSLPLNDTNLDCILHLQTLKYLYIKFTDVTANGISTILKSLPELHTLVAEVSQNENSFMESWGKQYPTIELSIDVCKPF